jgi:hypothetical protein
MDPMKTTNLVSAMFLSAVGFMAAVSAADAPAQYDSKTADSKKKPWVYQPVEQPAAPAVKNSKWVRTPVDAYVLAKLEAANLAPSKEAERATFIRRATLDTWGLLPTPEEVRAFEKDHSKDAYEKLVDRLLASPRYGERWGRRWLDLSRYADSDGYNGDGPRPNIWRYRDYVIKAFNDDKPYDRFVKEQLAGDELWPDDQQALIATGFLRNFPDEINARDLNLKKQEVANDLTDTVGTVLLGSTVGCAQCHNHKFDKISQKEYYQLQAYFVNTSWRDDVPAATAQEIADYEKKKAKYEAATKDIQSKMDAILQARHRQARGRSRVRVRSRDSRVHHQAGGRAHGVRPLDLSPQSLDHAGPHAQRRAAPQTEGAGQVRRIHGPRGRPQEVRQAEAEGARQHLDRDRAGSCRLTADVRAVQGYLRPKAGRSAARNARVVLRFAAGGQAHGDVFRPAHGARELDRESREPAHGPRLREPRLGASTSGTRSSKPWATSAR